MFSIITRHSRAASRRTDPKAVYLFSRCLQTNSSKDNKESTSSQSQDGGQNSTQDGQTPETSKKDLSQVLSELDPSQNQLLAPVHIPEDPNAVLKSDHPATNLLAQSGLVVTRQIEMMNIFLGFEQANRYVIMDPQGNHVGYMAEHDGGIAKAMGRQWFRTHRSFTTHVFDKHAQEVLRFHRPFSWINSTIRVYDPLEVGKYVPRSDSTEVSTNVKDNTIDGIHSISDLPLEAMRIIGEAHSEWAPLRRKYNLFLAHELADVDSVGAIGSEPVPSDLSTQQLKQVANQQHAENFAQFAYVNEPFLSWDFSLKGADDRLIGSVNRNFRGFGREIFTDTGAYSLRMDSAALDEESQKQHLVSQSHQGERAYNEVVGGTGDKLGMTLDQRAIMLATAVSVDFDYFSRHSRAGGMGMMPLWMGGGGGEAAGGAAGAEAGAAGAEAGGAVIGTAGRGVAGTAAELGGREGAIAGAGSLAGYDAMQRGMGRGEYAENAPPPAQGTYEGDQNSSPTDQNGGYGDPDSPQYGSPDSQSPQSGFDGQDPSSGDVWGSGDSDPWAAGGSGGEGAGGGGGGGDGDGWISKLWDIFSGGE